jgi:hypothetical protein
VELTLIAQQVSLNEALVVTRPLSWPSSSASFSFGLCGSSSVHAACCAAYASIAKDLMTTAWEAESMLELIIGSVKGGFHEVLTNPPKRKCGDGFLSIEPR